MSIVALVDWIILDKNMVVAYLGGEDGFAGGVGSRWRGKKVLTRQFCPI